MVAAVHAKHFSSMHEAAVQMVQLSETLEPTAQNQAIYDACYRAYLSTYPALRALMHERIADSTSTPRA
jgi:ribulose kinase